MYYILGLLAIGVAPWQGHSTVVWLLMLEDPAPLPTLTSISTVRFIMMANIFIF